MTSGRRENCFYSGSDERVEYYGIKTHTVPLFDKVVRNRGHDMLNFASRAYSTTVPDVGNPTITSDPVI